MAKIPNNAEKFPIEWDGTVKGGDTEGDSIPSDKIIVWGDNPFTWGDVAFIQDIADGIGTGNEITIANFFGMMRIKRKNLSILFVE